MSPNISLANILRMPLTGPQWEPQELPFQRSQQQQFVQLLFTCLNHVLSPDTIHHLPPSTASSLTPLYKHRAMSRKIRTVLESEQHDILSQLLTNYASTPRAVSLATKLAEQNLFAGILR